VQADNIAKLEKKHQNGFTFLSLLKDRTNFKDRFYIYYVCVL